MDPRPLIFNNRSDAGKQLAAALPELDSSNTVVVALPRGGVPVAAQICAAFELPLDLVLVRKIGAPGHPELAVGAVTDGPDPQVTVNQSIAHLLGLSRTEVENMGQELLPEIERRRRTYLSDREPQNLNGKTLIVVDDGVATGATLLASLTALKKKQPRQIIVALPVGPADLGSRLRGLADNVICLRDLSAFGAVGGAYREFAQVDDATVRAILARYAIDGNGST
ncbi:MAG: phosphoribosyltransferase family protein [Boseongicola sp.]